MPINVRRARKQDQQAVAVLWYALLTEQAALDDRFGPSDDALGRWNNDFPVWLHNDARRILVAERAETLVGVATAHRWAAPPVYRYAEEVYINELYVTPDERGKGAGRALVEAIRAWADELGTQRLRVGVLAANAAGAAFWEALDARPLSVTYTIELDAEAPQPPERRRIGF